MTPFLASSSPFKSTTDSHAKMIADQSAHYDGFEHEPRIRIGFGRKNFADNLKVWEKALAAGAVPQAVQASASAPLASEARL